jgi:hypothetical protein
MHRGRSVNPQIRHDPNTRKQDAVPHRVGTVHVTRVPGGREFALTVQPVAGQWKRVDACTACLLGFGYTMRPNIMISQVIWMSRGITVIGAEQLITGEGRCGVAREVPVNGSTTPAIR